MSLMLMPCHRRHYLFTLIFFFAIDAIIFRLFHYADADDADVHAFRYATYCRCAIIL